MWGFNNKKQKKENKKKYSHKDEVVSDNFVIYTMQDDINGKSTNSLKDNSRNIKETKKDKIKSESSPFLSNEKEVKTEKKSLFSFKKNKQEDLNLSIKKEESIINIKNNKEALITSKPDINSDSKTDNHLDKEHLFFEESSIKSKSNSNLDKKVDLNIDKINQEVLKNDNAIVRASNIEQEEITFKQAEDYEEKNNNKEELQQDIIKEVPYYDVKKEYEDTLKERNLSNFESGPSFLTKDPKKINKYPADKIDFSDKKSFSFLKLFTVLFLIIFILAGIVAGLWFTDKINIVNDLFKKIGIEIEIPQRTHIEETEKGKPDSQTQLHTQINTYSTDSLNDIRIKSTSTAVLDFNKSIKEISKTLEKEKNFNLIPFIVTVGNDKKRLSFRAFATMVNFRLPEKVLSNVGNDFVIYAYRSPATLVTRFSIVVDSLNNLALEKALNDIEASLVVNSQPLFVELLPSRSNVVFENSQYDSANIRFYNFKDGTNKSIDYAIVNNKLFIATSMETMHFLLDSLIKKIK